MKPSHFTSSSVRRWLTFPQYIQLTESFRSTQSSKSENDWLFFVYLIYSEKMLCPVLFLFTVQSPSSVSPVFPDMFYSCLRDWSLPSGSETSPVAIHLSPRPQQCLFQTRCFSCFSQSYDQIPDNKQFENMLRNTFVDVAFPSLETVLLATGLGVECGGDTVRHGSRQENTDLQPESRAWTGSGTNV